MNTDELDRDVYREWWETVGRDDLTVCPCAAPAGEDIVVETGGGPLGPTNEVRLPARPGFCARHFPYSDGRHGPPLVTRDQFAGWIIDGTFHEADATEEELRAARLVAAGFIRGEPN